MPLYLTDDFRLSFIGITFTINLGILVILYISLLASKTRQNLENNAKEILSVAFLLFIIHLLCFRAVLDLEVFIKYVVKFISLMGSFYISYLVGTHFIQTKQRFLNFVLIWVISSTMIIAYLIFYYLSLKALFLGNKFFNPEVTTSGKNQFQIYLAIVIPFIVYVIFHGENLLKKSIGLFALFVHSGAIIYIGSRGLWLTLSVAFIILFFQRVWKAIRTLKIPRKILLNSLVFVGIIFIIGYSSPTLETAHVLKKLKTLVTFFEMGNSRADTSMSERSYLLSFAIDNLATNPKNLIIGSGLGAFQLSNVYGKVTHNDYVFFIHDLGIFGLIIFIVLQITVWRVVVIRNKYPYYLLIPFYIDLVFINAYNFLLFWLLAGMLTGCSSTSVTGVQNGQSN